jgi:hypothetical protein
MAGIEMGSPPVLAASADAIPPGTLILEDSVRRFAGFVSTADRPMDAGAAREAETSAEGSESEPVFIAPVGASSPGAGRPAPADAFVIGPGAAESGSPGPFLFALIPPLSGVIKSAALPEVFAATGVGMRAGSFADVAPGPSVSFFGTSAALA